MNEQRYDDRDGWIWMDGEFVPWRDAKVHVLTHTIHYGSGVFEGERAYDGVIFDSRAHSDRLINSARLMDMKLPLDADGIERVKAEALAKSGLSDAYVRAFAWRGSEMMGVSAQHNTIHFACAIWYWGDYFKDKMKGIRIDIADWKRPSPENAPVHAKASGLYLICTLSKHAAENKGYADALMYDYKGRIAECTGAHVFFVRDGVLHTPTTECILEGITRRNIIALARRRGWEVEERDIWPNELETFSECFIVGTAAELTPVSEIAGRVYKPGVVCETLMNDYAALVRRKLDLTKAA